MKKLLIVSLTLLLGIPAFCCTSVIISGSATEDGRPLMLKHRDSDHVDNAVAYFKGPLYRFIGLVNASTAYKGEVWTGTNEAGFCIMNTASYNIKDDMVPSSRMDREGEVMYKALGICTTLSDFEALLDTLPRPMGVEANFGVIDAQGGAAYYEVNNHSWIKYDVNEIPRGYRVVTNFSESGRRSDYRGYERFITAEEIFAEMLFQKPYHVNHTDIFEGISRSFRNQDLGKAYVIPRKMTTASIVIEGVVPGENPLHTVMWTILGYPPAGVAVPLLVGDGSTLPSYMTPIESGNHSLMCDLNLERKPSPPDPDQIRRVETLINRSFGRIYDFWITEGISDSEFYEEYSKIKDSFLKAYLDI